MYFLNVVFLILISCSVCGSVGVDIVQLCFCSQDRSWGHSALFCQVIMTRSVRFQVFSLSSSHSICVEVFQRRPNMQERYGHEGWSGSLQFFNNTEFIWADVGKTRRTRHRKNTPGEPSMRNILEGGCFMAKWAGWRNIYFITSAKLWN